MVVNVFAGNWNRAGLDGCLDAASFIRNEVQKLSYGIPVYLTNWSRLFTTSVQDQADCMKATSTYFISGSPVKRVYWFGATDYGGAGLRIITNQRPSRWKDTGTGVESHMRCSVNSRYFALML